MVPNRITPRPAARHAFTFLLVALFLLVPLAGCGSESDGATTTAVPDKEADAEILNDVLARQLAAVRAYDRTLPLLRGPALESAREFRGAEQEHSNAIVKALRGLGEPAEPETEEIDSDPLRTQAEALEFLYAVESASVAYDLRSISHLTSPWPRSLLGSIAANQAQHLVVLRRLLGADTAESIPDAFEDGTTPTPAELEAEEE
ncbi:MAG TPA: ferritin-like domain-containing protein [Solirubrobacterales bacterium]|nr:ferritin-like domain-containing protein [Solirubrobacterales bacterium]